MIQRKTALNGVVIYQSDRLAHLGVPHAFSTRLGGVSDGAFTSLNLGNPAGQPMQDSTENIVENYRRLHEAIGCESRTRYFAHQVHGACVIDPATAAQTDSMHGGVEIGKADAIICDDPNALLSIRVADCVPILMASHDGNRVAAVHAGWRGVVLGAATETLKQFDRPSDVFITIGPSISLDAFEVGLEVLAEFQQVFGDHTPYQNSASDKSKAYIDLREALRLQLVDAGVPNDQIEVSDRCTVRDADEFFSHRRDNGLTGRMAAVIGVKT